jgi:hypothetical protein
MFCKNVIKKPYMFWSLSYDHPQGSSFVLSALPLLRLFALSFAFSAWLHVSMCVCLSGVPAYGLSGHDQTTHRQVHQTHTHIYSHTPNNANDEANKRRSGNALSAKDDP